MQIYGYIYAHLSTFMSIASNKLPVTIPDNFIKDSTIKGGQYIKLCQIKLQNQIIGDFSQIP